ncbi:JmjC domain-containing protein 8 [Thecamonas trahens ATCC 50062]|uniref:JmjC domain-containing protein 8 n=1 Tax=Thecamonas trahens ATCC 50062 TaxID=461836 RepID=A0A0L0DLF9_THETB|nr:JmjC domain-containing protein 8 [Thecamonas trahens ATCC 50062]KNC53137.1 JmjC domain-containing protein 8 [Thecamonas trahens ATCC 50062]|eukprot:XP_013754611.1 JmjC domain-containing protein 8 [Thecamonas trahens ATCC 50062]
MGAKDIVARWQTTTFSQLLCGGDDDDDHCPNLGNDGSCGLEVIEASGWRWDNFSEAYRDTPVVLMLDEEVMAHFAAVTEREALLASMGNAMVTLSSSNTHSYTKVRGMLADYVTEEMPKAGSTSDAEDSFYLFGDHTAEWYGFIDEHYTMPAVAASAPIVSPSFGIGGDGSGVAFHTHGPAFAHVVHGRKRWFLSPPDIQPDFDPSVTTSAWLASERYTASTRAAGSAWIDCTLGPREMLFIPSGWWHATLNLGDTVFISLFV